MPLFLALSKLVKPLKKTLQPISPSPLFHSKGTGKVRKGVGCGSLRQSQARCLTQSGPAGTSRATEQPMPTDALEAKAGFLGSWCHFRDRRLELIRIQRWVPLTACDPAGPALWSLVVGRRASKENQDSKSHHRHSFQLLCRANAWVPTSVDSETWFP